MTGRTSPTATARREATTVYRQAGWAVLRALLSISAVLAVYYRLPFDRSSTGVAITILVVGLVLLIALIAWQGPADRRRPAPGRACDRSTRHHHHAVPGWERSGNHGRS